MARQIKAALAASEEEVCGLLRQLSAKDSDIRVITSKANRYFMQMRTLERECTSLKMISPPRLLRTIICARCSLPAPRLGWKKRHEL
ncbi:hypothetical protein STCU_11931 [Strigomonas culicis]|uniref:Uncharacterized protein n=1 Tax=Strigomonas culicis TaxID=28005 RepID=S9UYE6_9TRYP|nr:hypothetical protein STCU_11931 [Strigomonas culicis]|eukprot:EPY15555.1 hypothetical protein STCU_11931 [Strigomonas culicis]